MRVLFVALVLSAALLYYRNAVAVSIPGIDQGIDPEPNQEPGPPAQADTIIDEVLNVVATVAVPAKYAATVSLAEKDYGLPPGLLARVLYRESHFRDDIITGKVRSSAGALGIAQFMPATAMELGVDPLDPYSAIPGAARYLARLYKLTGTWTEAVAAYNWGVGNVQRKGVEKAPMETKNYLAAVLEGLGVV